MRTRASPKRCGSLFWLNRAVMTKTFKIGDRISWNSGAGRVSGTVIRVHTHNFDHKSYIHHASPAVPQYRRGYCLERAVTARPRRYCSLQTVAASVLRNGRARVMDIALVVEVVGVHPDDRAADAPGPGIPAYAITDLEGFGHDGSVQPKQTSA